MNLANASASSAPTRSGKRVRAMYEVEYFSHLIPVRFPRRLGVITNIQPGEDRNVTLIRNISIRAVLNGFICEVGCQTVVFESHHALVSALVGYLGGGAAFEQDFFNRSCNRNMLGNPAPERAVYAAADWHNPHVTIASENGAGGCAAGQAEAQEVRRARSIANTVAVAQADAKLAATTAAEVNKDRRHDRDSFDPTRIR